MTDDWIRSMLLDMRRAVNAEALNEEAMAAMLDKTSYPRDYVARRRARSAKLSGIVRGIDNLVVLMKGPS